MFGLKSIKIFFGMILITVCVFIFEGYGYVAAIPKLLNFSYNFTSLENELHNFTCEKKEPFTVEMDCRPCSKYELKFEKTCISSGNIKKLKCVSSKNVHLLSCPVAFKYEAKKFWIFEGSIVTLGIFANIAVWWRRHILDSYFYQRIKRQISDSNA